MKFGHILGLPDFMRAASRSPGSGGLGTLVCDVQPGEWPAASVSRPGARSSFGWLQPAVIDDPAVRQKLMLAPVEGSSNECFAVLVRADGGEYLLLENRRKQSFDRVLGHARIAGMRSCSSAIRAFAAVVSSAQALEPRAVGRAAQRSQSPAMPNGAPSLGAIQYGWRKSPRSSPLVEPARGHDAAPRAKASRNAGRALRSRRAR